MGGQPTPGGTMPPGNGGFVSQRNRIRFKGVYRLENDFGQMLDLSPGDICNELERFSCFSFVHAITLGGVEAYEANIYKALGSTAATAPLSIERIALHACTKRYDTDVNDRANAILFGDLQTNADASQLADVNGQDVADTITRIFKRILLRLPTMEELELFRQMYRDITAAADAVKPAREWAILSCFVAMTSIESLFY